MDRGSGHAVSEEGRGALFLAPAEAEQLFAVQAGKWSEALAWAIDHQNTCSTADLDPHVVALRFDMPAHIYHLHAKESAKTLDHLIQERMARTTVLRAMATIISCAGLPVVSRVGPPRLTRTVLSVLCVWGASPLDCLGPYRGGYRDGLVRRYSRFCRR